MAHTVQAKKRIRQLLKHTDNNRMRMSRIRTYMRTVEQAIESGDKPAAQEALKAFQPELMRGVEQAIESGDKPAAQEALKAFQPELMRGVTKGVLHLNMAARRISRLNKRIKALG